jgi:hypothetical protein
MRSTFFKTFYTCSSSSLLQDPTVKIPKIEKIPFLLTELKMADLRLSFLRKMTVDLSGLKNFLPLWSFPVATAVVDAHNGVRSWIPNFFLRLAKTKCLSLQNLLASAQKACVDLQ